MLVPCYPTGVLYDLLECLSGHLDSRGLASVRTDRNILTIIISILYDIVVVFFSGTVIFRITCSSKYLSIFPNLFGMVLISYH